MASFFSRKDTDMTEGNITGHLISFAVPLLIGNIFQQLYNTVDSVVVGNFVGKEALAAVGSVSPIINTLIGFFMGLSAGASVVISQCYGARDDKNVHDAVHTTLVMTFILCAVFTLVGVVMVPYMLKLMSTPEDVFDGAAEYLRIYFYGVTGLLIYNMGSGILRAVGDSRRPLYFLIFSAVVNTVLDLAFVIFFHWGIAGVAIATVIAQCLSAALILYVLTKTTGSYRIVWTHVGVNGGLMRKIWKIGLPSALQQAITSFSNVFVQAYINRFGSACMAGWTSYGKIDQFALLPMQSLALSVTTFVGQNLGANNIKRAKAGTKRAVMLSLIITAVLIVPLMLFPRQLISMFNDDPEVLRYGSLFIRTISPFYLLCVINQIYSGSLRGAGDAKAPMVIMLTSFVVFRQIYLFVMSRLTDSEIPVALGYPIGWLLCSVLIFIYYKRGAWETRRVVVNESSVTV
jgi:putative MATE family efflux protein